MEDLSGILELLKGGGNAAIIALVIIAARVANKFLEALKALVDTQNSNHSENTANLEAIKRAIIARDPAAAIHFEPRP